MFSLISPLTRGRFQFVLAFHKGAESAVALRVTDPIKTNHIKQTLSTVALCNPKEAESHVWQVWAMNHGGKLLKTLHTGLLRCSLSGFYCKNSLEALLNKIL